MKPEPTSFTVGETMRWQKHLSAHNPQDGWCLQYVFVKEQSRLGQSQLGQPRLGQSKLRVDATIKDDYFELTISSGESQALISGTYWWQALVHKNDESYVVGDGSLEIKPNIGLLDDFDGRSHVRQVLDALEATLLGKASRDQLSYSIAGRSMSRLSPSELLEWRDKYKAEYTRELRKSGAYRDQLIKVHFRSI